jgi:predicted nucleic acid-binding protein
VRIVLDASAAVEVALDAKRAAQLGAILAESEEVLAPELLLAEIVNSIWKYHEFQQLELTTCVRALDFAVGLVDTLVASKELYREAFLLSRTTRRPAYDMFYLALAKREDAALLTLDNALRKESVRQGIRLP